MNLWNKVQENAANIPNPTCIGGHFKLAICITNGSEWMSAEHGGINHQKLEAAEAARVIENARRAAANPVEPADTSIVIYTIATEADIEPYPKLANPGRFFNDTGKLQKKSLSSKSSMI